MTHVSVLSECTAFNEGKSQYRFQYEPAAVTVLNKIESRPQTHIHFSKIPPFTCGSSKWSLSVSFSEKKILGSLLSHACHLPCQSRFNLFNRCSTDSIKEIKPWSSSLWNFLLPSAPFSYVQIFTVYALSNIQTENYVLKNIQIWLFYLRHVPLIAQC